MTDPVNTLLQRSLLTLSGPKVAGDKAVGKAGTAPVTVAPPPPPPVSAGQAESVDLNVRFFSEKAGELESVLDGLEDSVKLIKDGIDRSGRASELLEVAGGIAVRARDLIRTAEGNAGAIKPKLQELSDRFNKVLKDIDHVAASPSYGLNLLDGDVVITRFDPSGKATLETPGIIVASRQLGLEEVDFVEEEQADALRAQVTNILDEMKLFRQQLTSDINTIQTKQDFSLNAMQLLSDRTGSAVLPSSAEESANLLALQLRQQLSGSEFGLASDQQRALLRQF